jgi:hypothetical protein
MVVERYNDKPVGAIHTSPAQVAEIINAHVTQFIKFQKYSSVKPNAAGVVILDRHPLSSAHHYASQNGTRRSDSTATLCFVQLCTAVYNCV